jgi:16S rRNA (cytosine967-C5)-methyltransferase
MSQGPEHQSPLWQLMLWAVDGLRRRLSNHPDGEFSQQGVSNTSTPEHARAAVLDLETHGLRALGLTQAHLNKFSRGSTPESLRALLAVSMGALRRAYRPDFVLVDQTVEACEKLSSRSKGFVNAFLRSVVADKPGLEKPSDDVRCNAPIWWRRRLAQARLLDVYRTTCLLPPLFCLRYLGLPAQRESWQQELERLGLRSHWQGPKTLWLSPACPVHQIPGFSEGVFRVQDASAQRLSELLDEERWEDFNALDACAAPGGKTFLLGEHPLRSLWAMDRSEARLHRLLEESKRLDVMLKVRPSVVVHDLTQGSWPLDCPQSYDFIVLDAPCSGSGVVRRHPEIPWRQTPKSLAELVQTQAHVLTSLWDRLRPGGKLVYITCSIFPEEGEEQIKKLMLVRKDCQRLPAPGLIMPSHQEHNGVPTGEDGFFYARLAKRPP